jgi:hypothetical protein
VSGQGISVKHVEGKWQAFIDINNTPVPLRKFMIYTEPIMWTVWPRTQELHVEGEKDGRVIVYHYAVP